MATEYTTGCACGNCLAVVDCEGGVTTLAIELHIGMSCPDAQARYLAIYGVAWEPSAEVIALRSVSITTTAKTVR